MSAEIHFFTCDFCLERFFGEFFVAVNGNMVCYFCLESTRREEIADWLREGF